MSRATSTASRAWWRVISVTRTTARSVAAPHRSVVDRASPPSRATGAPRTSACSRAQSWLERSAWIATTAPTTASATASRRASTAADAISGVQRREALALRRQLRARGARQATEGLEADASALVAPSPRHRAVDEEGRERVRVAHAEDPRAMLLGQNAGAACVDEERRVPRRQVARERGRVRARPRGARQVEQLGAVGAAGAPQRRALEHRIELAQPEAGEAHDVPTRRGPEAAQVAPHEQLHPVARVGVGPADPVLGGREQVRAPSLPR